MNLRTNSKNIGSAIAFLAVAGIGWAIYASRNSAMPPDTRGLYGNVDIRDVNLGFRVGGRPAPLEVELHRHPDVA